MENWEIMGSVMFSWADTSSCLYPFFYLLTFFGSYNKQEAVCPRLRKKLANRAFLKMNNEFYDWLIWLSNIMLHTYTTGTETETEKSQ